MIYRAVQEPDRDGGEEVELDLCKRSSQSLILCSTGFLSRISRIGHLSKFLFCSIRRAGGKDAWQFLTSDGIYVHFHCQLISRRVASLAPYFSSQLATPLFHTYRHSTSYIYPFFFSFRTTGSLHMVKVAKAGCNGMNGESGIRYDSSNGRSC